MASGTFSTRFNEANSVENFIRDLLAGVPKSVRDSRKAYGRDSAAKVEQDIEGALKRIVEHCT
jgi:hypothetical protein